MTGRDDPLGRRALFGAPPPAGDAGEKTPAAGGRRALFSTAAPAPKPQAPQALERRVAVECGSCRARTSLDLVHVIRQLIPSVWVPTRRLSRLMRCPGCHRLTWCRLDWWGLLRG